MKLSFTLILIIMICLILFITTCVITSYSIHYTKLYEHDVLVVGGGDSALETAIATAENANSVILSYRKPEFSRPKEGNVEKLNALVDEGKITLMMESSVKEIRDDKVVLNVITSYSIHYTKLYEKFIMHFLSYLLLF